MNFGQALEIIKQGGRVSRKGWNEKYQYIELATCIRYKNIKGDIVDVNHVNPDDIEIKAIGFVGIGWLASQADILAEDWKEIPRF